MQVWKSLLLSAALGLASVPAAADDAMLIEAFDMQPERHWRFFSDRVMGGISTGEARFLQEGAQPFARMTGDVSTANNGGFIQMRLDLREPAPARTQGVRLVARGNNQRYFVHLRTRGTVLPWQYYQAGFDVTGTWTEFRVPLAAFTPSGAMLRRSPRAESLTSVAIVAFGRDHAAQIDIREIGFY